jgi:hypothetical protein
MVAQRRGQRPEREQRERPGPLDCEVMGRIPTTLTPGLSSRHFRGVSYRFSSFLSSFRKRQSVPRAMIFWGLDLIIPTSLRRRA